MNKDLYKCIRIKIKALKFSVDENIHLILLQVNFEKQSNVSELHAYLSTGGSRESCGSRRTRGTLKQRKICKQ